MKAAKFLSVIALLHGRKALAVMLEDFEDSSDYFNDDMLTFTDE